MATRKLTDTGIKNLPLPERGQVDYFDTLLPAFGLRVSHGGAKSFFVMVRYAGRLMRIGLGRYPGVSLADARDNARLAMDRAARGRDPRSARSDDVASANKGLETFGSVADEFIRTYAERRLRPNTIRDYRRTLGTVAADWRKRPIGDIARRDVLKLIDEIEGRGALVLADQTFAYLRKFFNWAAEREYIEVPPTDRIRRAHKARPRERVLSADELSVLWKALQSEPYPFGPLFKVLLLTGQRKSEVAGMVWEEIDVGAGMWSLPGERTKNGRPHLIPLSRPVLASLDACPRTGPFVFTTTGQTPVSGFSKAKARIDNGTEIAPWVLHDLRRSMATHMNEKLAVPPHVVEAVLNHISGTRAGVAGVYNRAAYLDERRSALDRWAEWVTR